MSENLDMHSFLNCLEFVKIAHGSQTRKFGNNERYYVHCFRVYCLVSSLPDSTRDMKIAALLHDVLEDCKGYTKEIIKEHFGDKVAFLVEELTNDKSIEGDRAFRKKKQRERLRDVSDEAKIIKMCDRLDNLSDIQYAPPFFAMTYLDESSLLLDCIGDANEYLKLYLERTIIEKRKFFES